MTIYLDDEPYQPGDAGITTVQNLVDELKPRLDARQRMIVAIACDQAPVPEGHIDEVLARDLGSFRRLDLSSAPILELARGGLAAAGSILEDTRPVVERVVALLGAGSETEALETLKDCIIAWAQVHASMVQTICLLQLDVEQLTAGESTVSETLNQLAFHLTQLRDCLQRRDYVLLNDILQYEILPAFEQWQGMIQAIRQSVPRG